jgi:hypothetical protein
MLFVGDPPMGLAGDYNDDGDVDAADYVAWRDAMDSNATLANETASPGIIDAADYNAWRANFGASASGRSAVIGPAVPEPTTLVLLSAVVGQAVLWMPRRRRPLRISGCFLQKYPLG